MRGWWPYIITLEHGNLSFFINPLHRRKGFMNMIWSYPNNVGKCQEEDTAVERLSQHKTHETKRKKEHGNL